MVASATREGPRLAARLAWFLDDGLASEQHPVLDGPLDGRDVLETLLGVYALYMDPIDTLGTAARLQHDPVVSAAKQVCEAAWLRELEALEVPAVASVDDVIRELRALAARDRLPRIYGWLARDATWEEVVKFLALEGGPDGGFDDLVAICQVGLSGSAKLELAKNYWDELGNGELDAVHSTIHQNLAAAVDMQTVDVADLPDSALARAALGGLLATNRWLQPEMVGALGLIELQAGPRCQLVLQAFHRCGAPAEAYPFYQIHADVDPIHGKDWLEKAVVPLVEENLAWGPRILRGAVWRSVVNARFMRDMADRFCRV